MALKNDSSLPAESWAPITAYEGFYEVSDQGNIRSLTRTLVIGGHERTYKGRVLRQTLGSHDYMTVVLSKFGKLKTHLVHRLVATAFVTDSSGEEVNHKDGHKDHNAAENLEWVSPSDNILHAWSRGLRKLRPIVGVAEDGTGIYLRGAKNAEYFGMNPANISNCAAGRQKTSYGYTWGYYGKA